MHTKTLMLSMFLAGAGGLSPSTALAGELVAYPQSERVCMARMTRGRTSGDREIVFRIPADRVAIFESRGFVARPCAGARSSVERVRESMCQLAAQSDREFEAAFLRMHGATPGEICELGDVGAPPADQ